MTDHQPGSPLAGNPLRSRADLQRAVVALWKPVRDRLSPGCARARLGHTGAQFANVSAELEGFARPLWALAPLAAGGYPIDWTPILQGLTAGTDPGHDEFWGWAGDSDQRLVEMASIGLTLALVPEQIWEPLSGAARDNLNVWLSRINEVSMPDNNWLFFRVMVNDGLARVDAKGYNPQAETAALDRIEAQYLGDGWYSDGHTARRDYYVAWAMHYYGLLYARLAGPKDPGRVQRFRERAAVFASDFAGWFAEDGSALPFGRSLTYRFAQSAFWGGLAFADVAALPWSQIKSLALRNLHWWARQPIFTGEGLLSIGYRYPNLMMAENYNSPGSPYWAMKFFTPLALPETHPFWQAVESHVESTPLPGRVGTLPHAGMITARDPADGHVTAIASGQYSPLPRHGAHKYAKFAYSTAFGFSIPSSTVGLPHAGHDSMLAVSDDGDQYWRVRADTEESSVNAEYLYSRWCPWPDVEVATWLLLANAPWHIRVHQLTTQRRLWTAEGGWAIDRTADDGGSKPLTTVDSGEGYSYAQYPAGVSGLRDLLGERSGEVVIAAPNTNLLHQRTVIPTLLGVHDPGEHWLVCAVAAVTSGERWNDAWRSPPTIDDVWTRLRDVALPNRDSLRRS